MTKLVHLVLSLTFPVEISGHNFQMQRETRCNSN